MTPTASRAAGPSQWTPREIELLEVTLRLLQQHGYDGLTVDAVAATGRMSKTTVYRRWPSKAELVLAAVIEAIGQPVRPPDTGSLRGDMLRLGEIVCEQALLHASTVRAVLVEISRNPALKHVIQDDFVEKCRAPMKQILQYAVDRGEIDGVAATDDLRDVLPDYLLFRSIISDRRPSPDTVRGLVDDVMLPSLTRTCAAGMPKSSRASRRRG
jgi:AcrR family transcriptional regulator